ncbi:MAG: helix-turn-helix domain-containing protein [Colwellia sp.]
MIDFLNYFAFTQMITCVLFLFPYRKHSLSIIFYQLLMVAGSCHLLASLLQPEQKNLLTWWIGSLGSNALPGLFWLVSLSVFGNNFIIRPWQYAVASFTLVINLCLQFIRFSGFVELDESTTSFLKYFLIFIELSLVGHALKTALKYWRDDLVQERRYIRGGVISIVALYIALVIVIEQLLHIDSYSISLMKASCLAFLVTAINFLIFTLRPSSLFQTVIPSIDLKIKEKSTVQSMQKDMDQVNQANTSSNSAKNEKLDRIIHLMKVDKFYQQEEATIANLALQVPMQEYKLRKLINGEMNFRNFNDFLNYYRIKEISIKLQEPSSSHIPILTFALESGFRSLSTFNKAFKETHGVTPTEYRKKAMDLE